MPYDGRPPFHPDRPDDSAAGTDRAADADVESAPGVDARQLLEDLSALVDAGLVVPLQGADGEVRVVPADPFDLYGEIDAYDQRS